MKNEKEIRIVCINTSAYEEENLKLITDLTDKEIIKTIKPIVLEERNGGEYYDNDMLLDALFTAYPKAIIKYASTEIVKI